MVATVCWQALPAPNNCRAQRTGGVDGCELDVEVLRVMVAAEKWEGLPGTYAPNSVQQQGMSVAGVQG